MAERGIIVDLFAGGGGASVGIEAHHIERFCGLIVVSPTGDDCWTWQGYRTKRPNGSLSYGIFCIGKRRYLAHRFAFTAVNGPIPYGLVVRHRCDNVACVRPDHLVVGTQADNLADMRDRGRAHFNRFEVGDRHPNAKLNALRVVEIRRRRSEGQSLAKIAAAFGMNPSTVHDIVRRRTWTHVPDLEMEASA
jgi:hypothetical protein